MGRPLAPLSLDLDNRWAYLMTHGDGAWTSYPSYLNLVVPRILDFLEARGQRITFFIVGRDAAMPEHHDVLAEITRLGHRVGNHSFDHRPWLHRYTADELTREFEMSEDAIESATGDRPVGFRGPGFSLSNEVISLLIERRYRYDASVFPNLLNPLSRAYYFRRSDLTKDELEERKALFGNVSDAFRPNRPFRWDTASGGLAEVPVTTFPLFRVPIHLSYLTYAGGKSRTLATAYYSSALAAARLGRNVVSMLLHPLDFIGSDDGIDDLGFFPGMNLAMGQKLELADRFLTMLSKRYELVPLEDYVGAQEWGKTLAPNYRS